MLSLIAAIHGHIFAEDSIVTWNNAAIKAAQNHTVRGLLMMRTLTMMHTAMFDAWTRYDTIAIRTLGHLPDVRNPSAPLRTSERRSVTLLSVCSWTCFHRIGPTPIGRWRSLATI